MGADEVRIDSQGLPEVSLESFRLLVSSVRDYAIFMLDPTGRVMTWNLGAERTNGYKAEEIIGQHFSRFYPEEDLRNGKPDYELRVAAQEGRFEDEGWRLRKDGTRIWANVIITALRDASGKLTGFGKVTRDLTERKQAEELLRQSEERMRLLLESVKDYAIFMLDPEGRVATWNVGAQRLKGYTAAEIIGQPLARFYPEEDVKAGRPQVEIETATKEGRYEEEGWRVRKDGSRFWASVVLTAVRDATGTLRGFAKITRDLTDRKLAEEERVRLAKADEAVRLRDEFLSLAAHELRTPLTPLAMHLQGLERSVSRGEAVDVNAIAKARRQLRRLSRLIDDLLDFSRVQNGRVEMDVEEFAIDALISRALDDFRATSDLHTFVFRPQATETKVRADAARVEQVLVNLLQNAVKYSPEGGIISVVIETRQADVWVSVTDSGIGIPTEEQQHLFERFFRAKNARLQNYAGLGLGLYLSNEIVQRHGGRFEVESTANRGATFRFSLPAVQEQAAVPRQLPHLLIVDDDAEILDATRAFLAREGYLVDTAQHANSALQLLAQQQYQLLLIDLMMPGMDGITLIERIRHEKLAERAAIAVFSADPRMREKAAKVQVNAALRKPVDLDDLLTTVQNLLVAQSPAGTATASR